MAEVVWTPSEDVLEHANVVRLMRRHGFSSYRELVARSIEEPEWFWPAAVEDTGIELYELWSEVVDLSRGPEWATWFDGAKLNIAWNCVHRWRSDRVAAVFRGEDGTRRELTFHPVDSIEEVFALAFDGSAAEEPLAGRPERLEKQAARA